MAESKKRKKNGHEVEDDTEIQNWTDGIPLSPAWWAPTFVALMILGLLWVVVYYISSHVPGSEAGRVEHRGGPGHDDGRLPDDAALALTGARRA